MLVADEKGNKGKPFTSSFYIYILHLHLLAKERAWHANLY